MFEASAPVRFFLGANTPVGFVSYAEDLYDTRGGWRAYIIKGGPGTGKGSMMRAVLQAMTDRGLPVEAVHCSSDPASLDAVIVPGLKACIVDGTAPHIIEPKYWGAVERIVNLGDCIDNERLVRQAPEILEATDACSALHARAGNSSARRPPFSGTAPASPRTAPTSRRRRARPNGWPTRNFRRAGRPGKRKTAVSLRRHARGAAGVPRNAAGALPADLRH